MSKQQLDESLESGHPVLMLVSTEGNPKNANHVTQIRGCGGGKYYFWDPEWAATNPGPHQKIWPSGSDRRSYSELLKFNYPTGGAGTNMIWLDTVF